MALPIPTGRTSGLLSRSTRCPDIRARYAAQGGDLLASQQVHLDSYLKASDSAQNCVHQSFSIINSVSLVPPDPPIFLAFISTSLDVMSCNSHLCPPPVLLPINRSSDSALAPVLGG